MVPELGLIALIAALIFALVGVVLGLRTQNASLVTKHLYALTGTVFLAILILAYSFWQLDLTVVIVHAQAHEALPWYYRIAALWGGHEGSMLLWIGVLCLWSLYLSVLIKTSPLQQKVIVLLCALFAGLLSFLIFTSNPFARYLPMQPLEGQDLNPLLQDGLMVIHPPILYAGYVGFAIPYCLAIAALWEKSLTLDTMQLIRKTALLAFAFLTLGIALGSFWAYYELGWGGWWFWDPVENASLMPWLAGIALIHTVSLAIHRQQYQAWMLLLCIITFALSMLGTFLVRSGLLTSVHSFAASPARGYYILVLFAVYIIPSLFLYAKRSSALTKHKPYVLLSREGLMLINAGLFIAMMLTVALGTLYPLILEGLHLGFISVGAPYFNQVIIPIFSLAVILMVFAPIARWGRALSTSQTLISIAVLIVLTIGVGRLTYLGFGVAFALLIAVWVLGYALINLKTSFKRDGLKHRTLSEWGMYMAHLGVVVLMLGVAISTHFGISRDLRMRLHDTAIVGDYRFTLEALSGVKGENFDAMQATVNVSAGQGSADDFQTIMYPQKRFYFARQLFISQTAIHGTLTRDIYIALAQPVGDAWDLRIYIKPFQRWIWAGALIIMLGAGLSFYDKRYLR